MSSAAAVINIPIDVMDRLSTATFEELAVFAEGAITRAGDHARQSIHHLIQAGGALLEMRDRMPGQYGAWLDQMGLTRKWAGSCQRLYTYRNELPTDVFNERLTGHGRVRQPSLHFALESISHLPSLSGGGVGGHNRLPEDRTAVVKQMLSKGVPVREIARMTGVGRTVIQDMQNPTKRAERDRRQREQRKSAAAALKALRDQGQREERDKLAKITGKEASVAYAAVRQALAALAKVSTSAAHVHAATSYLTAAESRIVAIMQEERANQ